MKRSCGLYALNVDHKMSYLMCGISRTLVVISMASAECFSTCCSTAQKSRLSLSRPFFAECTPAHTYTHTYKHTNTHTHIKKHIFNCCKEHWNSHQCNFSYQHFIKQTTDPLDIAIVISGQFFSSSIHLPHKLQKNSCNFFAFHVHAIDETCYLQKIRVQ